VQNKFSIEDSKNTRTNAMSAHDFLSPLTTHNFRASWVGRVADVPVKVERNIAVNNLLPYHLRAVDKMGGSEKFFWRCEQTHGTNVGLVKGASHGNILPDADALITNDPRITLGIYVADCAAIYIADPKNQAIGLVHSGRVGSEQNILGETLTALAESFGSSPNDLIITVAPCIRPPNYEVDFASLIRNQALENGVLEANYHDCGICTTSNPELYYSYRKEQGKTGRMLALMACGKT